VTNRPPSTRRRRLLSTAGIAFTVASAGCLRFTSGQSETATDSEPDGTSESTRTATNDDPDQPTDGGDDSDEGSVVYSTREEAIDYAGSFARGDPETDFGSDDGGEASLISFSTSSAGTSGSGGANDSVLMSEDLVVEAIPPGGVAFGGGVGRSLRIRNLATDSTLTYEPEAGTERYDVEGFDVETDGEGQLRDDAPKFDVAGSDDPISIPGSWSGDYQLFTHQPFARYVVELVEAGSVAGTTAGRIYGKAYQFGLDQTETTAFITRQHPVRDDWQATFYLGNPFQPEGSVTATHRPDDGVFEIDLTGIDVDPGEYDWAFQLSGPDSGSTQQRFIQLRSAFGNTVYVQ
jgi:hypothetical protein